MWDVLVVKRSFMKFNHFKPQMQLKHTISKSKIINQMIQDYLWGGNTTVKFIFIAGKHSFKRVDIFKYKDGIFSWSYLRKYE